MNDEKSSTFPNTRWTMVLRLRTAPEPQRQRAFEELCQAYWKPLYVFARRFGHAQPDAEDLTQGFFTQLLRRQDLGSLAPEQGRLRMFFKTAFRNFITDEARRETRQKRGGGKELFSLDLESAERQYQQVLPYAVTPEDEFDRQWARTILRRALGALREKFRARGRSETWRELEIFLGSDEAAPAYAEVAAKLGQTENTIAAAVRRMRQNSAPCSGRRSLTHWRQAKPWMRNCAICCGWRGKWRCSLTLWDQSAQQQLLEFPEPPLRGPLGTAGKRAAGP